MTNPDRFTSRLLDWFDQVRRDLPWRRTYDPYHVLVSEMMLQQTQVDRVVDYFRRWVARYPDVATLARADEEEALRLWEGLGYYSRARNLLAAAREVEERFGGEIPADPAELRGLPGIGPYTAGAVASIAYNREVPLVDANVERVLARVYDHAEPIKSKAGRCFVWETAAALIPGGRARDFNQALMELGALVCLGKSPRCSGCPVVDDCLAKERDTVFERPVPQKRPQTIPIVMATGVLAAGGRIFVQKRPESGVWAGLWEFPGGLVEQGETPEQALAREYAEETGFQVEAGEKISVIRHGYTKYRVTMHAYLCRSAGPLPEPVLTEATTSRWIHPAELDELALPAPHRKLVGLMRTDLRLAGLLAGC
jgi:A/G-specific adenine glycosylase